MIRHIWMFTNIALVWGDSAHAVTWASVDGLASQVRCVCVWHKAKFSFNAGKKKVKESANTASDWILSFFCYILLAVNEKENTEYQLIYSILSQTFYLVWNPVSFFLKKKSAFDCGICLLLDSYQKMCHALNYTSFCSSKLPSSRSMNVEHTLPQRIPCCSLNHFIYMNWN